MFERLGLTDVKCGTNRGCVSLMQCLHPLETATHLTQHPSYFTAVLRKMAEFIFHQNSEVCHPYFVFKLYGEVNTVKNTTTNVWLNDGVY